jgi:hypothetical protein
MNIRRILTSLAVSVLALPACTNPAPPLDESQVLKPVARLMPMNLLFIQ